MLPFSKPEIQRMAADIVATAPDTFESVLFVYGYEENGVTLVRGAAEKISEHLVGQTSRGFRDHVGTFARVIGYHMEDDNAAQTQGRIVVTCEIIHAEEAKHHA